MKCLKIFWQKWLVVARIIGNFQAQLILSLFYLIVLFGVSLVFKLLSDPLRLRVGSSVGPKSNFVQWEHPKEDLDQARKQY